MEWLAVSGGDEVHAAAVCQGLWMVCCRTSCSWLVFEEPPRSNVHRSHASVHKVGCRFRRDADYLDLILYGSPLHSSCLTVLGWIREHGGAKRTASERQGHMSGR